MPPSDPALSEALPSLPAGPDWPAVLAIAAWTVPFVLAAAVFAVLRSSLLHSSAPRVLSRARTPARRARIEPLLARADGLATSAGILEVVSEVVFAAQVLRIVADGAPVDGRAVLLTLAIAAPTILVATRALPTVVALGLGDRLLLAALPTFHVLQMPLRWIVGALDAGTRALMRVVGLRQDPASARQIVEGLREVIADSEISGDLDETEREIIGNVMEFRDVNVSALMTPRTEIDGVELGAGVLGAAREMAERGHSRLPVYDGSLDTIVGVVLARDVLRVLADGGVPQASLRSLLRPASFVPETKPVSELLSEFRREKTKLAVVLDEYGGTAGLVTLGDIVQELVGDIQDEFGRAAPAPFRRFPDGRVEVDAALRVSEVNGELGTELPEDGGFETLAGFVLSRLGRFPKRAEAFTEAGYEYTVVEASDRRVIRVALRPARQEVPA